jgi:FixJ family two-component response regulator
LLIGEDLHLGNRFRDKPLLYSIFYKCFVIKTHRARVMQKMGLVSVAELVRLAQKAGVAPAPHSPKVP